VEFEMKRRDVIVIGAGPYGLAAAARLRMAGLDVHAFGRAMSFWREHMPKGMLLRSPWGASHIGAPRGNLSLDAFERERRSAISRPIPLEDFISYGDWIQRLMVPDLDERRVDRVEPSDQGFIVHLADGDSVQCDRVVVAAGIAAFAARPPEFDGLPDALVSHSSEHADLGAFAGRRVAVVGAGQSAIESAALLAEAGAEVEVIMRAPRLRWVGRATRDGALGWLLFHRTDVGPAGVSQVVARPLLVRRLPLSIQSSLTRRSLAAGAALWLRPRIDRIALSPGRRVSEVARANGHLRLRLDDGTSRELDHVVLATGYRVDVTRYPFMTAAVVSRLHCVDGHPVLGTGFESAIPGLHFLGAPAVHSFGPLVRFVAGTDFAARALTRAITARRSRTPFRGSSERALEYPLPERAR
jgi:cation diffusion facilitator CzcD-associated flavoprotein CzcO